MPAASPPEPGPDRRGSSGAAGGGSPGGEPDYRFTLANERTFLAWIRTSLGLLAAGVGLRQFASEFAVRGARTALAVACVALAALLALASYPRWRQVQAAVRRQQPLPPSALVPVLAAGVTLLAVVVGVLLVVR